MRRFFRASFSSIAPIVGLALGMTGSDASAQATLTYSNQHCEASAQYWVGTNVFGNYGLTPDLTGADFFATEYQAFSNPTFSGFGEAIHGATFTPTSPMLGGDFSSVILDSCTTAQITRSSIGPHLLERAYGLASGVIEFSLSVPVSWTWIGAWQGQSFNTGAFDRAQAQMSLIDLNSPTQFVNQQMTSFNGVGDWVQNFSLGGTLNPGQYQLAWSHETLLMGGNTPFGYFSTGKGGGPLISCIDSTFSVTPTPAPGPVALLGLAGLAAARRRRS